MTNPLYWVSPVSLSLIAAAGIALLLVGRGRALPGGSWALAGLALFILGRFWSMGTAILPLRLHEAGMPLAEISRILFYWSLLSSLLGLIAYVFLAVGLWQGRLLGLAAAWQLKERSCFPAAGWAWRGVLLLFLAGLVPLGSGLIPALFPYLFIPGDIAGAFISLYKAGRVLLDGLGLLYLVGAFALGNNSGGKEKMGGAGFAPQASPAAGLVHLGVLFSLAGALVAMVISVLQRDRYPHLAPTCLKPQSKRQKR